MHKSFFILFSLLTMWFAGFAFYVYTIPTQDHSPETKTDAVIVLTGGSKRLAAGFKLLDQHKADKLFISGVDRSVKANELLDLYASPQNNHIHNIELGKNAFNTISNAQETKAWIIKNNIMSIRLVTANYHMPRSLFEFKRIMSNIKIIPHPVISDNVNIAEWWHSKRTALLLFKEYNKYLIMFLVIFFFVGLESFTTCFDIPTSSLISCPLIVKFITLL